MKKLTLIALLSFAAIYLSAQETVAPTPYAQTQNNTPHNYGKDPYSAKIKKHIISFGFFSPLNQHISFGYDQLLGTDFVFTSQLGIIGPGITNSAYTGKPVGAFGEVGAKLFFAPDFVTDGLLRYNRMQGTYFKPQIIISSFNYTSYFYNYTTGNQTSITNYTGVALMLNIGRQWILANSVTLDIYAGVGYAINSDQNTDFTGNYYSYESGGPSFPIAGCAGLNLGVPF